jgi:hypothetical protein
MEPTTLLPFISLLLLVSVEYGGWSLVGFLTGRGQLGEFPEQFFRAGHAHAGVLLVPWEPRSSRLRLRWGRDWEEWKTREMMDKEGGS